MLKVATLKSRAFGYRVFYCEGGSELRQSLATKRNPKTIPKSKT
jgi:hypothetical protein